jgi:hypothetical protein
MGQQQILLIVLGVIIVGIAVVVGINMFTATAAQANMDAVINDLLVLGARAQQYYVKPISLGGGGNSYTNITIEDITTKPVNENGTYRVNNSNNRRVNIRGIGKLDGDGNNKKVRVVLRVFADTSWTIIRQQ